MGSLIDILTLIKFIISASNYIFIIMLISCKYWFTNRRQQHIRLTVDVIILFYIGSVYAQREFYMVIAISSLENCQTTNRSILPYIKYIPNIVHIMIVVWGFYGVWITYIIQAYRASVDLSCRIYFINLPIICHVLPVKIPICHNMKCHPKKKLDYWISVEIGWSNRHSQSW